MDDSPLLSIENLHVHFATADGDVHAVQGIDLKISEGQCVGVVGESGSGKSQSFLAAMGLLTGNGRATGNVAFDGLNLLELQARQMNAIRGARVAMIFQDPLTSLTPHLRIGQQLSEVLCVHKGLSQSEASVHSQRWLDRVRIPQARQRMQQYPHQLSGGMRQRVMIAMAMLCDPLLLIADEPTTALDVTIQAEILDLMDEIRKERGTAIVLITHDMGVVARMCDFVNVMRAGRVVERGSCEDVFHQPEHGYTQKLLAAVPRIPASDFAAIPEFSHASAGTGQRDTPMIDTHTMLDVQGLTVDFPVSVGWFRRAKQFRAVDNISFTLGSAETLGIVGESGSGKSTLARAVLQLLPCSGTVSWLGRPLGTLEQAALQARRRDLQIVFQDPLASLNPSLTVGDSVMEPLSVHEPSLDLQQRYRLVLDMFARVGLDASMVNRYPHELSGGQNQRVGIARAMILKPKLVICDEAVSALDVSIQAQIIDLIEQLQREFQLSLIFITHDLAVVRLLAHRIMVMYRGAVMELADSGSLFHSPQHPYTRQLLSAVPMPDPVLERKRERLRFREDQVPLDDSVARLRFLPSRLASGDIGYVPRLEERFPGHFVAEHDAMELAGVIPPRRR
ncbi:MAG: dipeptide ABC transporter ATP-binding protein [Granulosicoccus sp.]